MNTNSNLPVMKQFSEKGWDDIAIQIAGGDIPLGGKSRCFFYHIHKVGGMSVTNSLRIAFSFCEGIKKEIDPKLVTDRYDTRDPREPAYINFAREELHFISSHFGFGHHAIFPGDWFLCTVVRQPLRRVISDYNYHCWRSMLDENRSIEGFRGFIRKPMNICMQCQHLSKLDIRKNSPADLYEDALENLEAFDLIGLTEEMQDFFQALWPYFGFPNLITTRWLETGPVEDMDFDTVADEVLEINEYDIKLYEYVRENRKVSDDASSWLEGRTNGSDVTAVASDSRSDEKLGGLCIMGASGQINQYAEESQAKSLSEFVNDIWNSEEQVMRTNVS